MAYITRITVKIKFDAADIKYVERYIVTSNSISYRYVCKDNIDERENKWSYCTQNEYFADIFDNLCVETESLFMPYIYDERRGIHSIEFTITLQNGARRSKVFAADKDTFPVFFSLLDKLTPEIEKN